ncbi:hypothetical protein [Lysinibacillus fusiformis]|uniref:hypothetical protein n=1 Tax=Lysinibacillus fusiformis TaxID=28031 RepID=UPI0021C00E54|nr:hypothetical protein [Lysinibacillus fusiformis]MDC6266473.1 hypothetical protein [Lysinibacillus sphaericus]MDN4970347.1 hypothetical protein [Lysinibacillus fusiformis]UXJ66796.1 hypothetical protein N5069_11395 [Lysinibacillus fusiformis]
MKIYIDGKDITKVQLTQWKRERVKKVFKTLGYKSAEINNPDRMIDKLTDLKMDYSYQEMYNKLESKLKLSEIMMRMAAALSRNRRKFSWTEIYLDGITAEEAIKGIENLMLNQSDENNRVNLSACPDHYALRPLGEKELEVIETAGNAPLPSQFFIVFDDETGLQTPRDHSYEYQSVGVARLKDGRVIGGVRHQIKDTKTGIKVKLSVEFPALSPTSLIKSHQMHLACEFSYWLQWIKGQKNNYDRASLN